MLESLFNVHSSGVDVAMGWKWAFEHPYLYFGIKISTPTLAVVVMLLVGKALGTLIFGRGRRN